MKCSYCDTVNAGDGRGRCVNCGAPYVPETNLWAGRLDPWEERREIRKIGADKAWEILNWRVATG